MKIKDASQYGNLVSQRYGKGAPAQEESKGAAASAPKGDAVKVQATSREVANAISTDQFKAERAQKLAELKSLVQSGNYFKSRNMEEIAASVYQGLHEQAGFLRESVAGEE